MLAAILVGAALATGALTVVCWIAGFDRVSDVLNRANWDWLPLAAAAVVVSHVGYTLAYREVLRSQGGPRLSVGVLGTAVLAGFGMLVPRAGFTLDRSFWEEHGLSVVAARGRILTLGMLEWALLAPAALVAAIVLFLENFPAQGGVILSWVIGVPAGAIVVAVLLLGRGRLPQRGRFWTPFMETLDAVPAAFRMMVRTRTGTLAAIGMAIYWAADITALGACLAVVNHPVPVPVLIVGFATGYAFTRRSLPFAGAGAAEALLPLAMHWMTVSLAAAVLAVFAYRLVNLWLPLAPAAFALHRLRSLAPALAPTVEPSI
jgi:uncharacterized membrane protein YbhN (UPF0104 family)